MTVICFSHLRWNFVYQRPQHLFTRFAKHYTVYFIEEPLFVENDDRNVIHTTEDNVHVVTQHLNKNEKNNIIERQERLLEKLINDNHISSYIFWYYSPMMYLFSKNFQPSLIVYDCMDELSAFKFAPHGLKETERKLFDKADVVFTGGYSLYHAKKDLHHNIYPFPSSIDKEHFAKARVYNQQPADQENIPHPRLGFFGVLDERFDIELIREAAIRKPDWNFIFLGPVIKINANDLPYNDNIHYPGNKTYNELPSYISGWDIALIPFALNESTRYISPTKTPEYLAAGKPVISTAISDVVSPYGERELVSIIHSTEEFIEAGEQLLKQTNRSKWLKQADEFLSENSWDKTFNEMNDIIKETLNTNKKYINPKKEIYV
jgi:UDP-galactopyranose mutase